MSVSETEGKASNCQIKVSTQGCKVGIYLAVNVLATVEVEEDLYCEQQDEINLFNLLVKNCKRCLASDKFPKLLNS